MTTTGALRNLTGIAAALILIGATAWGADRPFDISVINDATANPDARIKMIHATKDAVEKGLVDAPTVREALKKVSWSRGAFFKIRTAAVEELLADPANLDDTQNMLRLMLPTETQWEFMEYICSQAADRQWTALVPALVRSWSRPVLQPADDERPERKAIERLLPQQSAEETVFSVFSGMHQGGEAMKERERLDAYALLRRIDKSGERTRALLAADAPMTEDPLLNALRAGARDFRAVPDTGEQLSWLIRLRAPEHATFWSEASSAIGSLGEEQARGLEIRHAAIVRWVASAHPQWLTMTREDLYTQAKADLDRAKKHLRSHETAHGGADETLRSWNKELSWGDVLSIQVAMEAIEAPGLAKELFEQADGDIVDRTTEHGGVIAGSSGGIAATAFTPRASQRAGDTTFVAPTDMIEAGDTGLFHYHFHATKHTNSEYAGPSPGDIDAAKALGRGSLVFTFVRKDTMNADYYQGDGARIDIGVVKRPEGDSKSSK